MTMGSGPNEADPNDHSWLRHQHHPLPSAPVLSMEDSHVHTNNSVHENTIEEPEVEVEIGIVPSSTVECDSFDTTIVAAAANANDSSRPSRKSQSQPQPQPPSPTTLHKCSNLYTSLESIASRLSRLCANTLFAIWLLTGLPLLLLLPCAYDTHTKSMRHGPCHPMILLISFSWLINASLALLVLHALGYVPPGLSPWQAAAVGWSMGVSSVTYLQASLDGTTSEAMHCIMLRPFGIRVRPGGEGNTVGWFPSLIGTIPAIVLYFCTDWFGEVREELQCEEAAAYAAGGGYWKDGLSSTGTTSSSRSDSQTLNGTIANATLIGNGDQSSQILPEICPPWALPSQDGMLCCHVENQTGNWLEFSAYLAGSVLAGWAVIRFVALFLLWGDDDIQLEGHGGEEGSDGSSTMVGSRSTGSSNGPKAQNMTNDDASKVREVLIAFSRGDIQQSEIEYMLRP